MKNAIVVQDTVWREATSSVGTAMRSPMMVCGNYVLRFQIRGFVAVKQGDFASAASHYGESVGLYRKLGDDTGLAQALNNQGFVAQKLGDFASTATHCAEAADLYRKLGDDEGAAWMRDVQTELARQLEGQN